jgi:hypothetical protein
LIALVLLAPNLQALAFESKSYLKPRAVFHFGRKASV